MMAAYPAGRGRRRVVVWGSGARSAVRSLRGACGCFNPLVIGDSFAGTLPRDLERMRTLFQSPRHRGFACREELTAVIVFLVGGFNPLVIGDSFAGLQPLPLRGETNKFQSPRHRGFVCSSEN